MNTKTLSYSNRMQYEYNQYIQKIARRQRIARYMAAGIVLLTVALSAIAVISVALMSSK